jgi:hypothetical protein
MAWYDLKPYGPRHYAMMAWLVVTATAAGSAAGWVHDYFGTVGLSLGVGAAVFAVGYYLGKAIIRPD